MYKLPKRGGVLIDRKILISEAFRGLSGLAIQIYLMLRLNAIVVKTSPRRARVAEWAIQNNGTIRLTYKQIEKALFMKPGSGSRRISRAFDELISRGLVDLGEAGSGRCGAMNGYGFSDRWERFRQPDFKQAPPNPYRAAVRKRAKSAPRTPDGRFKQIPALEATD